MPARPPSADAQPVFRALADPTRRAIISMLAEGPRPIAEIAAAFDMTRPAVAKHLAILKDGGIIAVEAKGRERINRLNPEALKTAADWLGHFDRFWDERLAKLKDVVERTS
ncbi:ArsR/SmtB family transcription factor [Hyphococcus luteus]|uniref:Transcriptional regulator n=1 Tax=Hyphococcus luteus TaxID=2058213 RepID=A0A2S7JZK0_9PROT|nr:metalloregulator ArsR/SmtB family transcription factor [Marinicaulis flavus]PQA85646.1 transcriptional regulator [Marinicaulis flavus]